MKLLILGGTRFLGRALVESALARGHEITLYNRGQSNPGLFPQVERLTGDRKVDLNPLRNRRWDGVIDTCGYEPAEVKNSANLLSQAVPIYAFISTISVYADLSRPGTDENAPVAQLPKDAGETFQIEHYGPLKALCEQAAREAMPGRVLNIRPGLIVGEYDRSDRFTYWPWRIARGGEVLAPATPQYLTQFIDVCDLADWTIQMVEKQQTGTYNATGPKMPMTMGQLLETCKQVSGSSAHLNWVSEQFLLENGVAPWSELPLWLPESDTESAGMNQTSIDKALNAGLTFRSLADTIQSTLKWANSRPDDYVWQAGLPSQREAELLEKAKQSANPSGLFGGN